MLYIVTDWVAWSVGLTISQSVTLVSPEKNGWTDRDAVWVEDLGGPRESCIRWGSRYFFGRGNFGEKKCPLYVWSLFCHEQCKNGGADRFAVWIVDSGWPKKAQVQLYSPSSANVPSREGTLAPPGEYISTVCLRRRCSLMSNHFDHLLSPVYTIQPVVKPVWQPGKMFVYTIQLVVKPVWQTAVSCIQPVVKPGCKTGLTNTVLTTGCIV